MKESFSPRPLSLHQQAPIKLEPFEIKEVGYVKEIKKSIIRIGGLPSCIYGQAIQIKDNLKGLIIGFNQEEALALVLDEETAVSVDDTVVGKSELFGIAVGEIYLGRVIDCLGQTLDGKEKIRSLEFASVFREAASILDRIPISEPLLTGIKIIDTTIPIGKGQRELIIGDRVSGKSTLAIDTIINQKDKNVICVYCWVGGSSSSLVRIIQVLQEKNALDYTIILAAPASNPASQQYLAPYAAATLGEYFMYKGRDVLVVFDDLTKHAWVWRQLSLLLERPPGREAYPGDIFYLHSQLMERAGRLGPELGGGSMTFLPIVETQQGDVTGYIPSNLTSMTDGQIYLSTTLFHEGFKPAIDLGLSVSRIGSKVQCDALREVSGRLRLEYARYRETQRLSRLKTRLAAEVSERLRRGEVLTELFKQPAHESVSLEEGIILFYAFSRNILDVLPPEGAEKFQKEVYPYILKNSPQIIEELNRQKLLTKGIKLELDKAFVDFLRAEKIV
jgi:F-type H+-transporting ATPase subunit alpha